MDFLRGVSQEAAQTRSYTGRYLTRSSRSVLVRGRRSSMKGGMFLKGWVSARKTPPNFGVGVKFPLFLWRSGYGCYDPRGVELKLPPHFSTNLLKSDYGGRN